MYKDKYEEFIDLKFDRRINKYLELREEDIEKKLKKQLDFFYRYHGWMILLEKKTLKAMAKKYSISPSAIRVLTAGYLYEQVSRTSFYPHQLNIFLDYKNKLSIYREIKILLEEGLIEYGIRKKGRRPRYFPSFKGMRIINSYSRYFHSIFLQLYGSLNKAEYDMDLMSKRFKPGDLGFGYQ